MAKSKLPKIFLNLDFYSKGRNLRWIQDNGIEAIAILQNVWIASSQERGCKIKKIDAYSLPFFLMFSKEKVVQALESAVEVGLLEEDGENYYNSQIVTDSEKFTEKHNNYVKSHKKRKRIQSKSIEDLSQNQDESIMDSIDTDTEQDIDKDLDPKKKKKVVSLVAPRWVMDSEIALRALQAWIVYRLEKKSKLTQSTLDAQLKKFNTPESFSAAVDHSIEKGWIGLFEPDNPSASKLPKSIIDTRNKYEALDNQ